MIALNQNVKPSGKPKKHFPVLLLDEARRELFDLDPESKAVFISAIDDFETYGPAHPMIDTEKIEGDLFELKTQSSSRWLRGLYFHYQDGLYVISHIFVKKTNKTPKSNLVLGLSRYKAFRVRMAGTSEKIT